MLHYVYSPNIYNNIKTNQGDELCGYYKFFRELYNYELLVQPIYKLNFDLINKNDIVIIGGGGLLNNSNIWNRAINEVLNKCNNSILWSVGYNLHFNNKITIDINFDKINMISIRDYNHESKLRYVPCGSCMLPYLDIKNHVIRDIGIISHYDNNHRINIKGYNMIFNNDSIFNIVKFISESNVIITNSYHIVYWSSLMKKRVILYNKFSERFNYFKYKPVEYSGDILNDINSAKVYDCALDESREETINYFKEIKLFLNDNCKKTYNIYYTEFDRIKDINNYFISDMCLYNSYFNNKLNEIQNDTYLQNNWIKLFGIYNNMDYLFIYIFGIKISLKVNEEIINKIAWWIPIRKWRDGFRNKFKIESRAAQSRAEQS